MLLDDDKTFLIMVEVGTHRWLKPFKLVIIKAVDMLFLPLYFLVTMFFGDHIYSGYRKLYRIKSLNLRTEYDNITAHFSLYRRLGSD